jgi:secreted trypsin-like serine protease
MKRYLVIAVALLTLLALAVPVAAITNGEPTEDHPEVVLILMEVDGVPTFRCSGALMSPTIVLTAGHCAGAPGEFSGLRIFTEAEVDGGDNDYPLGTGNNTIEVKNWAAHPDYPFAPFFVNDVGMLELEEPYYIDTVNYASLPNVDDLDAYKTKRGKNKLVFNAVGYGLQRINPVFVEAERVRYEASPKLIQINVPGFTGDFSLLLSNNHSTGGTCFGDSGGPNYIGNGEDRVVGAVTSFGINGNCAGTGGVFRMDRQNVQDFIYDFIADPYTPLAP